MLSLKYIENADDKENPNSLYFWDRASLVARAQSKGEKADAQRTREELMPVIAGKDAEIEHFKKLLSEAGNKN